MFVEYEKQVKPSFFIVTLIITHFLFAPVTCWCWNPWKVNCPYRSDSGCIYPTQFCNGQNDCELGSDEDPKFCIANVCSWYQEKCPGNLQCIEKLKFCNGIRDCNYVQYRNKS